MEDMVRLFPLIFGKLCKIPEIFNAPGRCLRIQPGHRSRIGQRIFPAVAYHIQIPGRLFPLLHAVCAKPHLDLRLYAFKLNRQAFHPRAGSINNTAHLYSVFTFHLETVRNRLPLDHLQLQLLFWEHHPRLFIRDFPLCQLFDPLSHDATCFTLAFFANTAIITKRRYILFWPVLWIINYLRETRNMLMKVR